MSSNEVQKIISPSEPFAFNDISHPLQEEVLNIQILKMQENIDQLHDEIQHLKNQPSPVSSQEAHEAWSRHLTHNVHLHASFENQRTETINAITEEWNFFHTRRMETTEKMDALVEKWETLRDNYGIAERLPPSSPIGAPEITMETCFSAPEKEVIVVCTKFQIGKF